MRAIQKHQPTPQRRSSSGSHACHAANEGPTQTERLLVALRRKWHSYGDLEALRISTCPWKRLSESAHRYLKDGEKLDRRLGADGLLRLRVVKA